MPQLSPSAGLTIFLVYTIFLLVFYMVLNSNTYQLIGNVKLMTKNTVTPPTFM
uniref:ATP synthase F0 subunit 8 n=1 Tax=Deroceras laeve TaxID=147581 RepID=UPI002410D8C8|nr:ATP synthase F0 subunit 8 [Deroceras laeve]WEI33067.1 ATP synthase F0 subunit 8 [Deroceras laeve]